MGELPLESCWSVEVKKKKTLNFSTKIIVLRFLNLFFLNYRQCHNFQNDIIDSEIYTYLMKQIAPLDSDVDMCALMVILNRYWILKDINDSLLN